MNPDTEAREPCAVCSKNLCEACGTYELEGTSCCETCGRAREEDRNALSSGLLAMVGVGYLATLALGVVFFKARPLVGGLAAVVAIALGRAMQLLTNKPTVTRRRA